MNRFTAFAIVAVAAIIGLVFLMSRNTVSAQAPTATDLVVGMAYEVADFHSCQAPDGSLRKEWHFGGADRSRRNQLTPERDGRGRPIFRVITGDKSLPAGHMRLRKVSEADPSLEGFSYGATMPGRGSAWSTTAACVASARSSPAARRANSGAESNRPENGSGT